MLYESLKVERDFLAGIMTLFGYGGASNGAEITWVQSLNSEFSFLEVYLYFLPKGY